MPLPTKTEQEEKNKASTYSSWLYDLLLRVTSGTLAISYSAFQQFFNTFTILYFVGSRHCKITHSPRKIAYVFIIAMAASLPGSMIQLKRFYDLVCQYLGVESTPASVEQQALADFGQPISRWAQFKNYCSSSYRVGSFFLELGLMGLSGSNVVSAIVDPQVPDDKLLAQCGITVPPNGWYYKLGAGMFMVFCSMNHKLIIYNVRKTPLLLPNMGAAVAWALASFTGALFSTIEPLIIKARKGEALTNADILHIILLALSMFIVLPYQSIANVKEYEKKQNDYQQLPEDRQYSRVWKLLRRYAPAGFVTGATWYTAITGLVVVFEMFALSEEAIVAAIYGAGTLASLGYFMRFLHLQTPKD